jgi:hypothetical protein
MPNPTGSTYLAANAGYVWSDGDVYLIPQTDLVEAAAPGASFGGLGVANQPHQLLLNKIQLLRAKQLIDETNIAQILFLASSGVGKNGWLKFGTADVNAGQVQLILQWGTIDLAALFGEEYPPTQPEELPLPTQFSFNFTIAFPNAVWMLHPYLLTNLRSYFNVAASGVFFGTPANYALPIVLEPEMPLQLQGNTIRWPALTEQQQQYLVYSIEGAMNGGAPFSPGSTGGLTGMGWVALGY